MPHRDEAPLAGYKKFRKTGKSNSNETKRQVGFGGEMAKCFGNACRSGKVKYADRQISQRRHDARSIAGPDLRAVFIKAHVAHIMEAVFDSPMSSVEA